MISILADSFICILLSHLILINIIALISQWFLLIINLRIPLTLMLIMFDNYNWRTHTYHLPSFIRKLTLNHCFLQCILSLLVRWYVNLWALLTHWRSWFINLKKFSRKQIGIWLRLKFSLNYRFFLTIYVLDTLHIIFYIWFYH